MNIDIFAAYESAGVKLKNRIIRSATHEGLADERGWPTAALQQKYLQLAKGGVGALVTGYAGIQQDGRCPFPGMLMIDQDECVPAYQTLVAAVHAEHTPIVLQIAHCGRQTRSRITGEPVVAPSALRDQHYREDMPQALSEGGIETIITQFVKAIGRAREAGFDAVQLHAAHGYLLSQFLSPYMNVRKDQWGGSTENRYRIIAEIYRRAQTAHPGYPIWIKLNAFDGRKNGMRIEEAVRIAQLLETSGCSAIEVSCGVVEDRFFSIRSERNPVDAVFRYTDQFKHLPRFVKGLIKPMVRHAVKPIQPSRLYNVPAAQRIKAAVAIPVMVVGGIRTLEEIRGILDQGQADVVSLCRPFILEPNLVEKMRQGKQSAAKCLSCNICAMGIEEESLRCYFGKIRVQA